MLADAERKLRESGIALWLATLNPEALDVIRRAPLRKTLGHDRMFFDLEETVGMYQKQQEREKNG